MKYFKIEHEGPYQGYDLPLLFSEEEIQNRVYELGQKISQDLKNAPEPPIFIGVLNGSFYFMSDLLRAMSVEAEMDFLKISTYQKTSSTGTVRLIKDISAHITDRDIVIIEDIIDSGLSMNFLRKRLATNSPSSIRIATFLYKREISHLEVEPDYVRFNIPDRFVIGYGLDIDQRYRQLRDIYAFTPEDLEKIRKDNG